MLVFDALHILRHYGLNFKRTNNRPANMRGSCLQGLAYRVPLGTSGHQLHHTTKTPDPCEAGAVICQVLLVMFHSYDHIPLFMPFVYVSVSLDNLFQWVASIDNRLYLSRLDKPSEID